MARTSLHYRYILAVLCLFASFSGCGILEPPSKPFDQSLTNLEQFQLAFISSALVLSRFASSRLRPWYYYDKLPRYNPATLTLLERHEKKIGVFEPKWIRVWTTTGRGQEGVYSPLFIYMKGGAWLYALQAAKTSATLYGIWLGHVCH
jgi:hypothetical protein